MKWLLLIVFVMSFWAHKAAGMDSEPSAQDPKQPLPPEQPATNAAASSLQPEEKSEVNPQSVIADNVQSDESQVAGGEDAIDASSLPPSSQEGPLRDRFGLRRGSALGLGYSMLTDNLMDRVAIPISQSSYDSLQSEEPAAGTDVPNNEETENTDGKRSTSDPATRRRRLLQEDGLWQETAVGKLMRPQETEMEVTLPKGTNLWRGPKAELESILKGFDGKPAYYGNAGLLTDTSHYTDMINAYSSENVVMQEHEGWEVSSESVLAVEAHQYFKKDICDRSTFPTCEDFTAEGGCTQGDLIKIYQFVKKYGTHYVQKVQEGGMYVQRFTINTRSQGLMEGLEKHGGRLEEYLGEVLSGFRALKSVGDGIMDMSEGNSDNSDDGHLPEATKMGGGSGKESTEYAESRKELLKYMREQGIVHVGEHFVGGEPMTGSALEPKDVERWLSTVKDHPAPIRYTVQPLDKLIAGIPCEGKRKSKLLRSALKLIVASHARKGQAQYEAATAETVMDSKWETVEKAKADWLTMMRKWIFEKRGEAPVPPISDDENKVNADDQEDFEKGGTSDDREHAKIKSLEAQDAALTDEKSAEAYHDVVPANEIWRMMAHEAESGVARGVYSRIFNAPIFIFRQLSSAAYDCSKSCSAKRKFDLENYALIAKSAVAEDALESDQTSEEAPNEKKLKRAKESKEKKKGKSKTEENQDGLGGNEDYDVFRLSSANQKLVNEMEDQCHMSCGHHFETAIATVDSIAGAIDTELNRVFENFYKLSCTTCSRAVSQSAMSIAGGLHGGVIGDAPLENHELSPYCAAPGLGPVEKSMCTVTVNAISQMTSEATRKSSSLVDMDLPLSPRLLGLANCQSNCDKRSYSFANLGSGASPPVWATQVCGFFLGCPALEPDFVKILEYLRNMDARAEAEAAEATESRLMSGLDTSVPNNPPAIAAKKEQFCRDIQMLLVEAKGLRRGKVKQMQDQMCYICLRSVANPDDDKLCDTFEGNDEAAPADIEGELTLPGHIQVMMSGFDVAKQVEFRNKEENLLKKPESALETKPEKKSLRRRRLLQSANDALLELDNALEARAHKVSKKDEIAVLREALHKALSESHGKGDRSIKLHQNKKHHGHTHSHYESLLRDHGKNVMRFRATSQQKSIGEKILKAVTFAMPSRPMIPPNPKAVADCAKIDGADSTNMHCKYASIWNVEVDCNGQPMKPEESIKKILKFKSGLHKPFHGKKAWCKKQQKDVKSAIAKLVKVLRNIVSDASNGDGSIHGAEVGAAPALLEMNSHKEDSKEENFDDMVHAYRELHSRVFSSMTFSDGQHVPVLRSKYSNRASAEGLRDGYGAPLASGHGSMCVEINMCTPEQAPGMWLRATSGTPPLSAVESGHESKAK